MWNSTPDRILVPVDFGEASARAVSIAAHFASQLGSSVTLLHAEYIEAPAYFTHEQLGALERQREAARARATQFTADFGRSHGLANASVSLVEGEPVDAILAAMPGLDLVVMGTHGRRGPSRWLMGSVAERVVHESQVPILVVHSGAARLSPKELFAKPLIVAPPAAETRVSRVAEGLAQAFGGSVASRSLSCEADLARENGASLIVASKPIGSKGLFNQPVEQWLRSCTLPMLFVPEPTDVRA